MNKNYPKENVILEAVNYIFVNDNSDAGTGISPLRTYVTDGDNICQKNVNKNLEYPSITFDCEANNSSQTLPTGNYFLVVTISENTSVNNFKTRVREMLARVEYLLNDKPESLNSAVSAVKNLRCRIVSRINVYDESDLDVDIFRKTIAFKVICDDEIN